MPLLPDTFAAVVVSSNSKERAPCHVLDPIEGREHAAELLLAQSTYSAALAQLVGE